MLRTILSWKFVTDWYEIFLNEITTEEMFNTQNRLIQLVSATCMFNVIRQKYSYVDEVNKVRGYCCKIILLSKCWKKDFGLISKPLDFKISKLPGDHVLRLPKRLTPPALAPSFPPLFQEPTYGQRTHEFVVKNIHI